MGEVTTDNAASNDTMVEELADLVPSFDGIVNHTRCFAHTVNLIAKSILRPFDVESAKQTSASVGMQGSNVVDGVPSSAERALEEIATGLDVEDTIAAEEALMEGELDIQDDLTGWIDETALLTDAEHVALKESVRPVKEVLVKVSLFGLQDSSITYLLYSFAASCLLSYIRPLSFFQLGMLF